MRYFGKIIPCAAAVWLALAALFLPLRAEGAPVSVDVNGITFICPDKVVQGQPFFVRVASASPLSDVVVYWQDKIIPIVPVQTTGGHEAAALLGVSLRHGEKAFALRVRAQGGGQPATFKTTLPVARKKYPEQRLNVDSKFVELSEEDLARHNREKELVRKALETITPERWWTCPFVRPLPGGVSSQYGLRRFYDGEPRSPHSGVDLRGKQGEPVRATAAGRVVLTGDFFFGGKEVYVDHGQGLVSTYLHLSEILVQEGQVLHAGEVVGRVGMTGRVTGPHLHFGFSSLRNMIDPMPLFEPRCGVQE